MNFAPEGLVNNNMAWVITPCHKGFSVYVRVDKTTHYVVSVETGEIVDALNVVRCLKRAHIERMIVPNE